MTSAAAIIARNPIFRHASSASVAALCEASTARTFAAEEIILREGEPAELVYALDSGSVRVFHGAPRAKQIVVKLFRGPCFFGEAEAFARIPWLVSAAAVEQASILCMPPRAMLEFLRREPECAVRMVIDVGVRLAIASYHERSLAFDPSTIRLANYLLDYGAHANPEREQRWRIDLTQEAMAAAIGVTRRSVAADMAAWQKEGILAREDGAYIVLDVDALVRYGDPGRMSLSYRLGDDIEALFGESRPARDDGER
ncbi:MAG: Crp/Fnr family transcriptional regulator [Myxococcales bacterium]|nr:Crp/Fnr family transcriptional regulator [Myxococcales bacterium]